MNRFFISAAPTATILVFFVFGLVPAGEKSSPWKRFLPEEAYNVLTERSSKTIAAAAKAGDTVKSDTETAIRHGYRLSLQKEPGGLKKIDVDETVAALRMTMQRKESLVEMMEIYRNKAKGGEGIHDDLQYQPKLKNQNGIEALLGALAAKKLSDENLAKVEKELPRLSYRIAVTANLTQYAAPQKGKERWNALAIEMRDSALALAESAQKKNADGIMKAADALQTSCTQCHREFKAK
jgi:hypothetical protein